MTAPNYATLEELQAKVTVPSWIEAQDLLDLATDKIRQSSLSLRLSYRLASDGLPIDPATLSALARASVSQAAFWVSQRYNPVEDRIMPREGEEDGPKIVSETQQGHSVTLLINEKTEALDLAKAKRLAPMAARELRSIMRYGKVATFR